MNAILAVLGLSGGELILIFAVVLVLFGAKKIPEFAKGLGQGMKEFKKASREISDELQNAVDVDSAPPPRPATKTIPQSSEHSMQSSEHSVESTPSAHDSTVPKP